MKIFWTLVVLAVGACVAFLAMGQSEHGSVATVDATDSSPDILETRQAVAADTPAPAIAAPAVAPSGPKVAGSKPIETAMAAPAAAAIAPIAPAEAVPPAPAHANPALAKAAPPAAEPADSIAPSEEMPDKIDGYEVIPALVQHNDDGTTTLDSTYTIKGDGTKANPYEVTWEMLTSAQQTFDPKAGKKKIPGVVAFVHRKYVRVRGYVAFPLQVKEPRELLSMLNQWDGCCIGVPPTPYDAIEVNLTESVVGNARFATAGSVTGKFLVKPYVTGDWLVGLYVMNQGALDNTDFGGKGGGTSSDSNGGY